MRRQKTFKQNSAFPDIGEHWTEQCFTFLTSHTTTGAALSMSAACVKLYCVNGNTNGRHRYLLLCWSKIFEYFFLSLVDQPSNTADCHTKVYIAIKSWYWFTNRHLALVNIVTHLLSNGLDRTMEHSAIWLHLSPRVKQPFCIYETVGVVNLKPCQGFLELGERCSFLLAIILRASTCLKKVLHVCCVLLQVILCILESAHN